jgi:anti-sigma-K factor RskA
MTENTMRAGEYVLGVLSPEERVTLERDAAADPGPARRDFLATGDPRRFAAVAARFLGPEISEVSAVHLEPIGHRR